MTGEMVFNKIQYGKEVKTTHGTAVPATGIFPGAIKVGTDRKIVYPQEPIGNRALTQRSVIYQLLTEGVSLSMTDSIFQKLPFLCSMVLKGDITAAEQTGGQADYLWDFTPSLTAANIPDSTTIEFGDDTQAYEMEYCIGKSIKFSGKLGSNEAVKVEIPDLFARQISTCSFTAALSLAAGEPIVANNTQFTLDSTWATLGTTAKAGVLREWSVEIKTGNHPNFSAGNTGKFFYNHSEGRIESLWTLVFEGNATADAIWDDFRAQTERALRISVAGAQIGSGATHSLIIDGFGTFEEVIPLSQEADGNNLHAAIFHTYSDAEATPHSVGVQVTTSVNAI